VSQAGPENRSYDSNCKHSVWIVSSLLTQTSDINLECHCFTVPWNPIRSLLRPRATLARPSSGRRSVTPRKPHPAQGTAQGLDPHPFPSSGPGS